MPDGQLPVYTIIAALYREAKSVASLMQAIDAFDYPREKLQVILALEPDDLATRAAIARLGPMPHVQVLIASAMDPKTKPKALNCGIMAQTPEDFFEATPTLAGCQTKKVTDTPSTP